MKIAIAYFMIGAILVTRSYGGVFRALLYSDWITCNHDKTLNVDISQVLVYFYDFQNHYYVTYQIDSASEGIFDKYNFDVSRRLIFYVPGFNSHIHKSTEEIVRQTFADVPNSYLIIIDHSRYTSESKNALHGYQRSVLHTYYIGIALAKLLAAFHNKGLPTNNIHAIGHSLGGQMLGFTGTEYTKLTAEKIWRITGLDPADPCFSNGFINDQIRAGVAQYVEVYHCNLGVLGTTSMLADTDFIMNDGKKQPTCHKGFLPGIGEAEADKCSHKKCIEYWMKTVDNPSYYLAWACDSYEHFSEGLCADNQVTQAGFHNPGNTAGVFYVSTESYGVE